MSLLYAPTEASLFGHIKWTFGQTRRTMDATVQGFEVSDCFLYVYESTVDGDGEHGEEIRSEQRNDKRQKQPTGTITRSTLCTCRPTCTWFVVYKLHLQSFVEYLCIAKQHVPVWTFPFIQSPRHTSHWELGGGGDSCLFTATALWLVKLAQQTACHGLQDPYTHCTCTPSGLCAV